MGPENCKLFFWTQIKIQKAEKNKPKDTKKVKKSREYIVHSDKNTKDKDKKLKVVGKSKEIKMTKGQGKGNRDQKTTKDNPFNNITPSKPFLSSGSGVTPAHL